MPARALLGGHGESAESRIFRQIRLPPVAPNDIVVAMTKDRPIVSEDRDVMGGATVFRGARVPVQTLLDHLNAGESIDDFLEGFPSVTREHVDAFLAEARDWAV